MQFFQYSQRLQRWLAVTKPYFEDAGGKKYLKDATISLGCYIHGSCSVACFK